MTRGKSLTTATAVSLSPSGASPRYRLIDGREQERRVGKELLSILAREDRGGAGDRDDQVRLGTIGEGGSDVVDDRLFWRADKPCRTHDDLDDVHGLLGALVQFDAEVAGELVHRQRCRGRTIAAPAPGGPAGWASLGAAPRSSKTASSQQRRVGICDPRRF